MLIIQSPYKYLQGPGVFKDLAKHVKPYAEKALILASKTPLALLKDSVMEGFKQEGVACEFDKFNGEVTHKEVDRIVDILKKGNYDCIVGMGGGKAIDTAKSAAFKAGVEIITAPTIASSDAPCSSLAVIYSEEGHVVDVEFYSHNPAAVVIDSQVVANAPTRLLLAGMGDALATYCEARVCFDYGFPNCLGSQISLTAFSLAELCFNTLLSNGNLAKKSVDSNLVSPALERVIEANTFLSSVGFESGGLSAAHSIQDALTTIPECHAFMHGERVAFGALCLLVLEGRPEADIDKVLRFNIKVGLPVTLRELGLTEKVREKIEGILPIACPEPGGVYHMPPGITQENMLAAILLADKLGEEYLSKS